MALRSTIKQSLCVGMRLSFQSKQTFCRIKHINMSKPTLYTDKRSPVVRSVLFLIEELQLDFNYIEIDLFNGEQMTADFLEVNPLHTVPVLRDGDLILTDSHAILIYLAEKYGDQRQSLWPSEQQSKYKALNRLLYIAAGLFRKNSDAMSQILVQQLRSAQVESHVVKLKEELGHLETFLQDSKYLAGDELTIVDIAATPLVSNINLLIPIVAQSWPNLHNWFNTMRSLPSYEKANAPGLNALKTVLQLSTDYPIA